MDTEALLKWAACLARRQSAIAERCLRLEAAECGLQTPCGAAQPSLGATHERLRACLEAAACRLYRFVRVSSSYYDETLERRRDHLGAASVEQLCKTLALENTAWADGPPGVWNPRFVLVVVQYGARFDADLLKTAVHEVGGSALSRRRLNWRLAGDVESLTSYQHGGVTPLGSRTALPVVLSHRVAALPFMWLGAGEVSLKMGLRVRDFVRMFVPLVAVVSD